MLKAIIFDCFGVLTSDGWLPFADKHFGNSPVKKQEAHDLNKQLDSGFITYDEFYKGIAALANVSFETAKTAVQSNVANSQLFDLILELKKQYKIGVLSNAGANWLDRLFTKEQNELFDAVVLSCDIGHIKPHPRMYHAICDKLSVQPQEAVFIDDIERYVTGAKDIGMQGIHFKNLQQLQHDLEQLVAKTTNL